MGIFFGKKKKSDASISITTKVDIRADEKRLQKELAEMQKQRAAEKAKIDKQHKKNMEALDFSRLVPGNESIKFSSVELDFLDYINGMKISKPRIAKRWTEKGIDFQKSIERMFLSDLLQFNPNGTSLQLTEKGENVVQADKKKRRDIAWRTLSQQSQEHLKQGKMDLYRNDLFNMATIRAQEGRRDGELCLLFMVCYLDVWPFSSIEEYQFFMKDKNWPVSSGFIFPEVICCILSAAEALGYSSADIEQMFCHEVRADMLPTPAVSVEECAKLIRMHMDGESAQADKLLKEATEKFKKTQRRK